MPYRTLRQGAALASERSRRTMTGKPFGRVAALAPAAAVSVTPMTRGAVAATACQSACAPTKQVKVGEVAYAYREVGPCVETPVILLQRFRGTMDEWDPAFLDALSRKRHVVIFDNVGVSRTNGVASPRLKEWASGAGEFIKALGFRRVDLLGFSFGGLVAQQLTLDEPDLVRRLVVVGSGAGFVDGHNVRQEAIKVATKPVNADEDFLYLFFRDTPTSQAAGRAHLARLKARKTDLGKPVSPETWMAMLSAGSDVGTPETSLLKRASDIRIPVLVANGVEDVMIPTYQSYALAQALPDARLIIYPDSGHAYMFQFPERSAADIEQFLAEPRLK